MSGDPLYRWVQQKGGVVYSGYPPQRRSISYDVLRAFPEPQASRLIDPDDPQVRERLAFALEGLLSGGLVGEEDRWAGFLLNVIKADRPDSEGTL